MTGRLIWVIGSFLAGGAAATGVVLWWHNTGFLVVFPSQEHHIELLSLFLGAASLIITAVAMIMAVAAFVGYAFIKEAAIEAGRKAGDAAARSMLWTRMSRDLAATGFAEADTAEGIDSVAEALSGRDQK